jgi:drug/metabolite transporter (DMT)-like permease
MWLLYALIGGIATAFGSLISKKSVAYVKDPWMRSFYFSFFFLILIIPFFLFEFDIPKDFSTIIMLILASIAVVIGNYLIFKSYMYLNASSINVIQKLKLAWILIIGIVFLKQSLQLKDIIGMTIIFAASLIIIDYKNWKTNYHGVMSVIVSTLAFSAYAFAISLLSQKVKPFSLLFFLTIIPVIMYCFIIKDLKKRIIETYKKTRIMILAAAIGVVYNLCMVLGVKEEPTKVFFVIEAGIILIVIGEYFWMKDKRNILLKILAVALAIAGAILLR